MIIDVIIPSHRREYRIGEVVRTWLDRATLGTGEGETLNIWIACEYEDQKIYSERLDGFKPKVQIVADNYGCYVEAVNRIAKATKGSVIFVAADDVLPCPGYDKIALEAFQDSFPAFDGVLRGNDLIHGLEEPSNTHPVIGREYYNKFGYVYYPGYFALWADTEFAWSSQISEREARIPTLVLEHLHHTLGKTPRDFTHEKPLSQNLSGERLFNQRKIEGFPVFKDGKLYTLEHLWKTSDAPQNKN